MATTLAGPSRRCWPVAVAPTALAPREAGIHAGPDDSIGPREVLSAMAMARVLTGRWSLPVTRAATHTLDTLLGELAWRGLLADRTPGLEARLATGRPLAAYNGMDPSGPSLHLGHLVPIFGLLHLQRHGGRPVLLVGGATGMIGDPSGTSAERNLLDRDTIAANVAGDPGAARALPRLRAGLRRGDARQQPRLARRDLDARLPARRRQALHDPVHAGQGLGPARLDAGLSYTEFSYMLLQAADFQHLYRTMGVEAQVGGADQWGNITAGLELIRKTLTGPDGEAAEAFALSYPLLLDPSGAKFGKTSVGTSVWLDPARTSPYAFYQFLVDRPDTEVGKLLRLFTIMDRPEIEALEAEQAAHPERRPAQRALALDLTTRVHGVAGDRARGAREPGRLRRGVAARPRRARGDVRRARALRPAPPRISPAGRCGWRSPAGCSRRTARPGGRSRRAASRSTTCVSRRPRTPCPNRSAASGSSCGRAAKRLRIGRVRRRERSAAMTSDGGRPRSARSTRAWYSRSADSPARASRVAVRSAAAPSAVASSLAARRTSVASSVTLRAAASTPPSSRRAV